MLNIIGNVPIESFPLLDYILGECSIKEKNKKAVDFKDEDPRTIIVVKPRVFCEKWKTMNNFEKSQTPTYTKLEKEIESYEQRCKIINLHPVIKKVRKQEFQLIPSLINETPLVFIITVLIIILLLF